MRDGENWSELVRRRPLATLVHLSGPHARIAKYVRTNKRCPADDFFGSRRCTLGKRFNGQFDALTKTGASYVNDQRFTPLRGAGKPLWEFKEFDHRLYCWRRVVPPNFVVIVLFSGWVKQKKGKSKMEGREIKHAMDLYQEFLNEGGTA